MDADNKFNLLSKKVVDFSFADRYTCKVSPRLTNDKFLGVIGGYGDETFSKSISVTGKAFFCILLGKNFYFYLRMKLTPYHFILYMMMVCMFITMHCIL